MMNPDDQSEILLANVIDTSLIYQINTLDSIPIGLFVVFVVQRCC